MPKLTIDNREIEVAAGTKVIEAAERLGIVIPRFCYHPALGSVGACRVCAVAFLDGPVKGIQMSCMVNAMDGMVVSTTDDEAVDFRRHVIEWLMLHHPHDCPVCDEGGHCLLQDTTIAGGHGLRRYRGNKRTHRDQDLGPLVQHEMNRCIQCYRCTRYYQDYAGYRDLGVLGIGSRVYFGRTAPGRLESPFAGNLIDICPTGVYTDKPSRYFGRRWDFQRAPSLCLHCSLGCNLVVSARYRQVVRHEARFNREVNGHFICDRGRYAYGYNDAANRPRQALIAGQTAPLAEVVDQAGAALKRIAAEKGPHSIALLASDRSSLETLAMLKQVSRLKHWQGPAIPFGERQATTLQMAVSRLRPEWAVSLGAISAAENVFVFGTDPINEAPMLALSLRQAQRQGGNVTVLDPRPVTLPLPFVHHAVHPDNLAAAIASIRQRLHESVQSDGAISTAPTAPELGETASLARQLANSRRTVIVCGTDVVAADVVTEAAKLAETLNQLDSETKLFFPLTGANGFALALMKANMGTVEDLLNGIETGSITALVVAEQDLWRSYANRRRLTEALDRLEALIVLDHVASPLAERANWFIPTQTIYESGGHWINQEGRLQIAQAVLAVGEPIAVTGQGDHPPRTFGREIPGSAPAPAWAVLAALAGEKAEAENPELGLKAAIDAYHPAIAGLDARRIGRQIDFSAIADKAAGTDTTDRSFEDHSEAEQLTLLLVEQTFGTEALSANTPALKALKQEPAAIAHPEDIDRMGVQPGQSVTIASDAGRIVLPLLADDRIARGVIIIPKDHCIDWQELGATKVLIALDRISVRSVDTP